MKIGAKSVIIKPVDPEKLLQTIIMCTDLRIIAEMATMGTAKGLLQFFQNYLNNQFKLRCLN